MRFIILLSLLTALIAASPIRSPRSPNTALAPINKRFEASVPWIWRPKKADFEQFEDEGDETATESNADANAVINKRNNGPWHWQTSKEISGQFKDGAADVAAGHALDKAPGAAEGAKGGQK
ncbi:hypothetical protein NEUTE1DRAFT_98177 [Neurospora tetrasperma FGSC 2508]|uniref:Uncharacterized protein n=1 Tax=Neurospora tetrasperma (strain FGSC 2508 / ATCC MYA-4615 / P0657) TaxID=510951 RepID=F8MB08_NEUT8|nr:uncharacterized protein NEUTE1DRAFT_98177 [Neurospora tetrasperma FGSC 2508]EGO61027.1 hypothetical protein NEUTE1DRAFT_98177 [Neurospora tetrasperma FGSC 2508]EGZ74966.1 hypothetical protein NEUTE2DRAFT_55895 [Neurospora tetrasperma FGSC 2509]